MRKQLILTKMYQQAFFKVLILTFIASGICSCGTMRKQPREVTIDSTRVEIRHRTIWVNDTLKFQLPQESTTQIVKTDSSHLETSVATSDARINSDGTLFHSLANKDVQHSAPVKRVVEYRDSIVYRDREKHIPYPVERELTWWQQTKIKGFWILFAILLISHRKGIFSFIRKII